MTQLPHCVDILDICRYLLRAASILSLSCHNFVIPRNRVSPCPSKTSHKHYTTLFKHYTTWQRDRMCDPYLAAQSLPVALQNLTLSSNIVPRPPLACQASHPLTTSASLTAAAPDLHFKWVSLRKHRISRLLHNPVYITAAASAGTKCPLHRLNFNWSADDNISKLSWAEPCPLMNLFHICTSFRKILV